MEIQEKFYSVLLTEAELALFSEFEERLYSKKDEYLNGKETDHQEKSRKKLVGGLVGSGAVIGAELGALHSVSNTKNLDKAKKIADRATDDSGKVVDALGRMVNRFKEKGSRFKDQQTKEAFDKVFEWGNRRVDTNLRGANRAFKVAEAMDRKDMLKKGAKGALIGTAVTGGLAYAANKALKNQHEETNRSRRGKKK